MGIQEIAQRHGLLVATYGHAGDGNLHPQILYDESDPEQVERMEKVEEETIRLAISLKGTLSGEHGIGLSKANYMTLEHDPVEMALMRQIKRTLDPNNIMNPGKRALTERVSRIQGSKGPSEEDIKEGLFFKLLKPGPHEP